MCVEGQQQRGAFLDKANSSMAVAMNTALVAFGLAKPPFEVQIVLRQVLRLSPDEQPRGKARHHTAHVVLHGVSALLELHLQALELCLPFGGCARRGLQRRLDCPDRFDMGLQRLLDVLDGRQPAVNVAR
jgi:hypothetical protein